MLVAIIIVLVVVGGGVYFQQKSKAPSPIPTATDERNTETEMGGSAPTQPAENIGASGAKLAFEQIRLGIQQKLPLNNLAKYFTAGSQQMISTPDFSLRCVDMTYEKEVEAGNQIIVTGDCVDEDGDHASGDYVFSNENGVWKLDFPASIQRSFGQPANTQNAPQPTTNGKVDLMVMDIQVTPSPPKAGDKTVKIEARFKNNGTKTFTGSINTKALIGTKKSAEQTGFITGTIAPGETKRFTISYSGYLLLTGDATPGPKNVHFALDYDNKVTESNENNNTIDQIVNFVP